jgi:hypothetical protein
MKHIPFYLALLVLLGILKFSHAQEDIREADWFLSPLTPAEEMQLLCMPELKMPAGYGNRDLPDMVDNSQHIYMRPAFQQAGLCCGQASCVGYNFTYEMSRERDLNATLIDNQYPTHFSWNFMNGGEGWYGVSYLHSIQILKEYGMPDVVDYGGSLSYGGSSRWMSGYTEYYNGMHNRINNAYQIQVGTPEGLLVLKHWLHSHLEDSPVGGIASFYAQHMSASSQLPAGTPEAGKYVLTYFGGSANHAMTIVGYNDSIRWDYNEDGQYTNDIDINDDGEVDMKDWEIGGFKMVQSYGGVPNWGDQGFAYMMYKTVADNLGSGGIWNHCVHVLDVKESYEPKLTAKVTLKHSRRDHIKVLAGISNNVSRPIPEVLLGFPIYDYQGGTRYMQGGTTEEDKTITLGLDLSKLLSYINLDQNVKIYLQVVENDPDNSDTGDLIHFSIFDHTGSGNEIICPQNNVPLNNDDTTTFSLTHNFNFNRVAIADESLPAAPEGEFYSYQLTANGGTAPYTWEFDKSYTETTQTASFPMVNDVQLTPTNSSSGFATRVIDFDFPYYDSAYSLITVHVDGYLMFDQQLYPFPYYQDDKVLFNITRNISPFLYMGQDLGGGGGLWYEGDEESATFRWKTAMTGNSSVQMNYAVTLYPDGTIRFFYGSMNGMDSYLWFAGISDGDNYNYQEIALSSKPVINPNTSITLAPYDYPDEMELSSDGLFTGTPSQSYGNELITFKVTDNNFIFSKKTLTFSSTGVIINDSIISGGDPVIAFGETAWMSVSVLNVRPDTLANATMTIQIDDPYISLIDNIESLGNIDPGEERNFINAFRFEVAESVPDQHLITIHAIIESDTSVFESNMLHYAYAPIVAAQNVIVDDDNNRLDAGDNADIIVPFLNSGGVAVSSLNALLSTLDPYITLNTNFGNIPLLNPGQTLNLSYNLTVSQECPPGHEITFNIDMTGDGNFMATDAFTLVSGLYLENFETGNMRLFAWGKDGSSPWTIDTYAPYEGTFSARSGVITHGQESVMLIDMNVLSDGNIGFYQRTSCEGDTTSANNYDYLCFKIDGEEMGRWDGETSWDYVEFPVEAGTRRFEWVYHKDNSTNYRFDAAWVDLITFPSAYDCSPSLACGQDSLDFLMRWDETENATIILTNNADGLLEYTADIAGIEPVTGNRESGGRSIEGSYLVCDGRKFHTGNEYLWNLRTYNGGNDNEWIKQVYVDFPQGVEMVATTDFTGGSGGPMVYQGPFGNGVTGHWFGEDASGWGVVHMGETAEANVSVIPQPSLTGDITVDYEVKGEVYGGTPHDVFGSFKLRNLGPVTAWLDIDKTEGTLEGGSSDSLVLTVNTAGMADGKYQAWVLLQDNFDHEMIVPVQLTVDTHMGEIIGGQYGSVDWFTAFPNPFNEQTNLIIDMQIESNAQIEISNIQGQLIQILNIEPSSEITRTIHWNGCDLNGKRVPAGIYLGKLIYQEKVFYVKLIHAN